MNVPDKWVVLEFNSNGKKLYKVFAGWYGGYLGSDSWKLNSGIVSTSKPDEMYIFAGYSGSEYHCHEHCYGMSMYMLSILSSFQEQVNSAEGVTLKVLSKDELPELIGEMYED
jgi:hypothetical protein